MPKGSKKGSPQKGSPQKPSKGGSKSSGKDNDDHVSTSAGASDGFCPWLDVDQGEDIKAPPKPVDTPEKNKKPKKKNKQKDQPNQERDSKSPKLEETDQKNGELAKPLEKLELKSDQSNGQKDISTPMNWEDEVAEKDAESTSPSEAKQTKKENQGPAAPEDRDKIKFSVKSTSRSPIRSPSSERPQHAFKKPKTEDTRSSKPDNKPRERSNERGGGGRRSDSGDWRAAGGAAGGGGQGQKGRGRGQQQGSGGKGKVQQTLTGAFQDGRKTLSSSTPGSSPAEGFTWVETKGDLFFCEPDDALAHCVSEDLRMGAGIALEFRKRFKRIPELEAQNKKVGEVAILDVEGSYIYNLITKKQYNHKPSYKTLQASLESMLVHCKANNVKSVAMPQIGCGLDLLDWGVVTDILKEVFKNTGMTIKIYIFDKKGR